MPKPPRHAGWLQRLQLPGIRVDFADTLQGADMHSAADMHIVSSCTSKCHEAHGLLVDVIKVIHDPPEGRLVTTALRSDIKLRMNK